MKVEIVVGEVSSVLARVYVRVSGGEGAAADILRPLGDSDCRLSGSITGPHCAHAHTLPATIPLRDLGSGPTPLAEATLPDPCFWSPESPNLYEANVLLHGKDAERRLAPQSFGLRRLTTRGESLHLDGKRFVVRGVASSDIAHEKAIGDRQQASHFDMAGFREHSLALLVPNPTDGLCEAASREGVLLLADLRALAAERKVAAARRLAGWPAVGIVVLGQSELARCDLPRSVLVAQWIDCDEQVGKAGWADLLIARVNRSTAGTLKLPDNLPPDAPILAIDDQNQVERKKAGFFASQNARTACNQLQSDLAPQWDLAGYIVVAGDGLPSAQIECAS